MLGKWKVALGRSMLHIERIEVTLHDIIQNKPPRSGISPLSPNQEHSRLETAVKHQLKLIVYFVHSVRFAL